jgi:PAS domain S-box-containing protein
MAERSMFHMPGVRKRHSINTSYLSECFKKDSYIFSGQGKCRLQKLSSPWSAGIILFLILFCIVFTAPFAWAEPDKPSKRVLILHSFEPFLPYSIIANRAIQTTLLADKTVHINFFSEYLDLARFPDNLYLKELVDLYRQKYSNNKPDVIIAILKPAFDFLMKQGRSLFPDVPIVFCGIEKHQLEGAEFGKNTTGVLMEIDPKTTLNVALRLHPNTKNIAVIAGAQANDKGYEATAKRAFREYEDRFKFIYLSGLSMKETLEKLRNLPAHTIVVYVTMFQDGEGKAFVPAVVARTFSEASNSPVYSLYDSYMGNGIVGGRLVSFEMQGKKAGELGQRILKGEKPSDIPFIACPTAYMFDWREMKRWRIKESLLPPESSVLFKIPTMWEMYKWHIMAVAFFLLCQFLFIVVLFIQRLQRRKAEKEAIDSRNFLQAVLSASPVGICSVKGMAFEWVSEPYCRMIGYAPGELIGKTSRILFESDEEFKRVGVSMNEQGWCETRHLRKDGSWIDCRLRSSRINSDAYVIACEDITLWKQLESELVQSQKMEAIGTLAGGVAHDFNNILSVVMGYAGLMDMDMKEDNHLKVYIRQILSSVEKAASLTGSLLAFSRKQVIDLKPVNVNEIIKEAEGILSRLIGEDIEMTAGLDGNNLIVLADRSQLVQILMNLATNARDAMPAGGMLRIETKMAEIDDELVAAQGFGRKGRYAAISVSDSGFGIDEKNQQRIFEPFFTTKEVGKGSGLGLSMIYGILQQHNGFIQFKSTPGQGTTFNVYLPLADADEAEEEPVLRDFAGGTETILVAEDEADLRALIGTILTNAGYTVLEAVNGEDAVVKFEQYKDTIDIVVLDVVMPKMNGKEAYNRIKKLKPAMPVLFFSGYTDDIIHKKGVYDKELNFISKPIIPFEFLNKIRGVLDNKAI